MLYEWNTTRISIKINYIYNYNPQPSKHVNMIIICINNLFYKILIYHYYYFQCVQFVLLLLKVTKSMLSKYILININDKNVN